VGVHLAVVDGILNCAVPYHESGTVMSIANIAVIEQIILGKHELACAEVICVYPRLVSIATSVSLPSRAVVESDVICQVPGESIEEVMV